MVFDTGNGDVFEIVNNIKLKIIKRLYKYIYKNGKYNENESTETK